MDATYQNRPTLKAALETPAEAQEFWTDKSLIVGFSKETRPFLTTVYPLNDATWGQRQSFRLPRAHFIGDIDLQFDLSAITAILGDFDLFRNGYIRPVASLIDRVEIKYNQFVFVVPADGIVHYALLRYNTDELAVRKRTGGWLHGSTYEGTNRTGGTFQVTIPSPWVGQYFPAAALAGEVQIDVYWRSTNNGLLETSQGTARFMSSNIGIDLTGATVDGGANVTSAAAYGTATVIAARPAQNVTPSLTSYSATAGDFTSPTITNQKLQVHCINIDEDSYNKVIEKVNTTGYYMPMFEYGFVDAPLTFSSATTPTRINISQINGLVSSLAITVRRNDRVNVQNGGHSLLNTLCYSPDLSFYVELNNQRLFASEPITLRYGAKLLSDTYNVPNTGDLNRPVMSGVPFCVMGDSDLIGKTSTGYIDSSSSTAFNIVFSPSAAMLSDRNFSANGSTLDGLFCQVRGIMKNILVVNSSGVSKLRG